MNDKELLELAAKAAGYAFRVGDTQIGIHVVYVDGHQWNPLTDDGDALRLAVKLWLDITFERINDYDFVFAKPPEAREGIGTRIEQDPLTATRRAIVRAAAEIGGSMK
jgi:hypothetical protein